MLSEMFTPQEPAVVQRQSSDCSFTPAGRFLLRGASISNVWPLFSSQIQRCDLTFGPLVLFTRWCSGCIMITVLPSY